jgi:D-xylonolactonase
LHHHEAVGDFRPLANQRAPLTRDQQYILQGWFADILPDLNRENLATEQFLIQRSYVEMVKIRVEGRTMSHKSPIATMPQLELIADYACEIGENPLWHPIEKRLYWCDIPNGRLFRYDPATATHEQCYEGKTIGGFTIQADGSLLLFMDQGTVALWREDAPLQLIAHVESERSSRFNDVIADPYGRVFCGTMSSEQSRGSLYRLDVDGSIHQILQNIGCSNGMAFTLDRRGFYYTDSFAREIYLFDYNREDGSIGNQRIFAHFNEADGLPDGVTLDAEDRLWCAMWDGSCIVRFLPNGAIDKKIQVPARKTSSLTFGGDDYTDVYITTAGGNTKEADGPLSGALFRLRAERPGLPEFFSRILLAPDSSH